MLPLDVADDPREWSVYRGHLLEMGMVGDAIEAHAIDGPSVHIGWAYQDSWPSLGREGRRILVAATWPDAEHGDVDLAEWASHPRAARNLMQVQVGSWALLHLLAAAKATGFSPDDTYLHLRRSTHMPAPDLELLFYGHATLTATSILAIAEALRLTFDGEWRCEPLPLRADIRRSVLAHQIAELTDGLTEETLVNMLALGRRSPRASPYSAVDPRAFQRDLDEVRTHPAGRTKPDPNHSTPPPRTSRYRSLYEHLVANSDPTPKYTLATISSLLLPDRFGNEGLPEQARVAEGRSWWSNGTSIERSHVRAWQAAGYLVDTASLEFVLDRHGDPDLDHSTVTFIEKHGRSLWHRHRHDLDGYRPPRQTLATAAADVGGALTPLTRAPIPEHLLAFARDY